jgi:hypothetical protein
MPMVVRCSDTVIGDAYSEFVAHMVTPRRIMSLTRTEVGPEQ